MKTKEDALREIQKRMGFFGYEFNKLAKGWLKNKDSMHNLFKSMKEWEGQRKCSAPLNWRVSTSELIESITCYQQGDYEESCRKAVDASTTWHMNR